MPDRRHFGPLFPDQHFADDHFAGTPLEPIDVYLKTAEVGFDLPQVVWDVKIQWNRPREAPRYVLTDFKSLVIHQAGAPPRFHTAYRFSNGREFEEPTVEPGT